MMLSWIELRGVWCFEFKMGFLQPGQNYTWSVGPRSWLQGAADLCKLPSHHCYSHLVLEVCTKPRSRVGQMTERSFNQKNMNIFIPPEKSPGG